MKKCVIFGAGEYSQLQTQIQQEDLVIAVDGGYPMLLSQNVEPQILVGDMDSLADEQKVQFAKRSGVQVIELPAEKDDTDMLAALKIGLSKGYQLFELYGGLGGRFDHSLANIQCLLYLHNQGAKGYLFGKNSRTELIHNEKLSFTAQERGTFSMFAFGGDAFGVSEIGFKYELDHATIRQDTPIGISNEFIGHACSIEVENGTLLVHILRE